MWFEKMGSIHSKFLSVVFVDVMMYAIFFCFQDSLTLESGVNNSASYSEPCSFIGMQL